jgi:SAM-dependent methyltransferase
MCNSACIEFIREKVSDAEIRGKKVLEVGACDINGSARKIISSSLPSSYLGIDIVNGPGVDEICSITDIVARYGEEKFDIIVALEIMEHIFDWKNAVSNIKRSCKKGGIIVITTRSEGFRSHGFPCDYWRYNADDIRMIFADFEILTLRSDPIAPGIFMKARKKEDFQEAIMPENFSLYSVIKRRRTGQLSENDIRKFQRYLALKRKIAGFLPINVKDYLKNKLNLR